MKKVNRFAACFLILVMLLSLTACNRQPKGDIANQEKLFGTWYIELDMTDELFQGLEDTLRYGYAQDWRPEFDELLESYNTVTVGYRQCVEFNEDMTCTFYVDEADMLEELKAYNEEAARIRSEIEYALYEDRGIDRETADKMSMEERGMTVAEAWKKAYQTNTETSVSLMDKIYWFNVRGEKLILTHVNGQIIQTDFEFIDDNTLVIYGTETYEYKRDME